MKTKEYTMSDDSIGQIAKTLQVAILTGTDIVDNLRVMKFTLSESSIVPSQKYLKTFNENIDKLMEEVRSESNEALVDE